MKRGGASRFPTMTKAARIALKLTRPRKRRLTGEAEIEKRKAVTLPKLDFAKKDQ
jgi:hypothetical protein